MGWAAKAKHTGEPKPPTEDVQLTLDTDRLRLLASQIDDERHLQMLLDTITDTVMRTEVENLLRPMLCYPLR